MDSPSCQTIPVKIWQCRKKTLISQEYPGDITGIRDLSNPLGNAPVSRLTVHRPACWDSLPVPELVGPVGPPAVVPVGGQLAPHLLLVPLLLLLVLVCFRHYWTGASRMSQNVHTESIVLKGALPRDVRPQVFPSVITSNKICISQLFQMHKNWIFVGIFVEYTNAMIF
jgi:hypothetical protein